VKGSSLGVVYPPLVALGVIATVLAGRLVVRSTLEQREDGPWVLVAVEDAGVGFGEADAPRLFISLLSSAEAARDVAMLLRR
jgi:signal transduction histidine kinase